MKRKHKEEHSPGETQDTTDDRTHFNRNKAQWMSKKALSAMDVEKVELCEHFCQPCVQQHTLHQPHEVGVESLEGNYGSNSSAERPHSVLYKIYNIILGATLRHTKTWHHTITTFNTGMR